MNVLVAYTRRLESKPSRRRDNLLSCFVPQGISFEYYALRHIEQWPNRLRFCIWDAEIVGSSPVYSTNGLLVKLAITPALHAGILGSSPSWSTSFFMFLKLKELIVRPSFYGLEVKETLRQVPQRSGRASGLHPEGRRFDSYRNHQVGKTC